MFTENEVNIQRDYIENELDNGENFLLLACSHFRLSEEEDEEFQETDENLTYATNTYGARKVVDDGEVYIIVYSEIGECRFDIETVVNNFKIYSRYGNKSVFFDKENMEDGE